MRPPNTVITGIACRLAEEGSCNGREQWSLEKRLYRVGALSVKELRCRHPQSLAGAGMSSHNHKKPSLLHESTMNVSALPIAIGYGSLASVHLGLMTHDFHLARSSNLLYAIKGGLYRVFSLSSAKIRRLAAVFVRIIVIGWPSLSTNHLVGCKVIIVVSPIKWRGDIQNLPVLWARGTCSVAAR